MGPISVVDLSSRYFPTPHHVHHRDALRDAGDKGHAGIGGLKNGVHGEGSGNEDEAHVCPGLRHSLADGVENWSLLLPHRAAPAGGHPGHQVGPVLHAAEGVEGSLPAGNSLYQKAGILVDQNAHWDLLVDTG